MKKVIKRALLIVAAIFILLTGVGLYYYIPMFLMRPAEAGQINNTNISVVEDFGNSLFLIKAENGYILIDAGLDIKKIEKFFIKANINLNDVKWIFITHSDGDHVSALPLFPDANIYMSKDEMPLINGTAKRTIFGGNTMPRGINIEKIIPLSDGQEVNINGTRVRCIASPGHTPGSMSYLVDGKYLFTGDAFKVKNGKISMHPYTMDVKLAKKTIELFRGIIDYSQLVITSHYGIH